MIARTGSSEEENWIIHISKIVEMNDTAIKERFSETPLSFNSHTFYFLDNQGW
jgi:hypothetical protein